MTWENINLPNHCIPCSHSPHNVLQSPSL